MMVVPMLKNVEETIAGIINKIENGLKIPPVNTKELLKLKLNHIVKKRCVKIF